MLAAAALAPAVPRRLAIAYPGGVAGQVIERAAAAHGERSPGPQSDPRPLRRARDWAIEHPLVAVALLALAVRLALAAAVAVLAGGTLFPDDVQYLRLAGQIADHRTQSWTYYEPQLYERTGTLLWPVVQIFKAFGNVGLLAQLYVVAFGVATAVLTTKLGLSFLSRRGALLAGAFVALLPSQILWSSIVMKDALVWCLLAGLAVLVVEAQSARGWRLAGCGVAAVGALVGLAYLRFHTLEIALVALLLASLLGPARGRVVRVAGAATILLCLPLAFGLGAGGVTFVSHPGSLAERRANNAIGANTAVVAPRVPAADPAAAEPAEPASPALPAAESERAPDESILHYAPKGLTVITLRPFPWEAAAADRAAGIRLAGIEALLWYALLALAIIGVTTLRGRLRYMAFPLLAGSATALMYGVTEGNVGTAYRHRGEFVWVVALLAAMGVQRLMQRRAESRGLVRV